MDGERTSQVPEPGFLCHPAIPAARSGACWQWKLPKLSTYNVTLITQQEQHKGGEWSCSLPVLLPASLSSTDSCCCSFFFLFSKVKSKLTNRKQLRVWPLPSNCPEGLTHLSEPSRNSWKSGGCHGNTTAFLPPESFPEADERKTPLTLPLVSSFVSMEGYFTKSAPSIWL